MNPPGGARSQIQAGVEYESAQNHTVPDVTQPRVRAAADARLPVPSAQIRAAESFTRPCSLHRGGRSQRVRQTTSHFPQRVYPDTSRPASVTLLLSERAREQSPSFLH
ncbi:unnamed protein product [Boreogadus saida]